MDQAALAEMGHPLDDTVWAGLRPAYYEQIEPTVSPRDGVRETLQTLHDKGLKLGIVSNTWWSAEFHDSHLARYGLLDGRQQKLADIGKRHGISAERVRQLERQALATLRRIADPDLAA